MRKTPSLLGVLGFLCAIGAIGACKSAPADTSWSKAFPATFQDAALSVPLLATDAVGNVALAGSVNGTIDFGSGDAGTATSSSGFYLTKLDATGNVLWAKQFPGSGYVTYHRPRRGRQRHRDRRG